ncbi:MAG: ferredoxin-type protein NapG [Magnetococcales bacterium]|nr:ferredoxin-type protein NapG [Magnetococcales bacterium]
MATHGRTKTGLADLTRREFLQQGRPAAVMMVVGFLLWWHARSADALPPWAIRPPGALPEQHFLGICLRCGLCVRACPYHSLVLAEIGSGVVAGTPYFLARHIPCEMCPEIPCVKACPSGALSPKLQKIADARMGLAVLADQENCLAFLGLRCEVCYQVCPVTNQAITLEMRPNVRSGKHALFLPVVHSDHCTGCGKCEQACVLERAAIRVLPHAMVKGELGSHYLLGWKEKEKSGQSLIPELLHLPVRQPEPTP